MIEMNINLDSCTGKDWETLQIMQQIGALISCEIVALQENFIDRPESYESFSTKSGVFLAHS
jgi:hypothetical protein